MITGIVVALPEELTTLTAKRIDKGQCAFITDTLLLACSGAGNKNAETAAEQLIAKGATQLISWGCAAALTSFLKAGDLVLADKLIASDQTQIDVDANWHQHSKNQLSALLTVHSGSLLESTRLVSSSADKHQLHIATGAIALDMESGAVASVAKQHALPFLAVRVIVDPVTMNLPRAIHYSLNEQGDIVMSKLLLFLVLHPLELMGLIKLGVCFKAARKTLAQIASQLDTLITLP